MHSKDGMCIVYARPASFQIQNGGYVIRVHGIYLFNVQPCFQGHSSPHTRASEGRKALLGSSWSRLVTSLFCFAFCLGGVPISFGKLFVASLSGMEIKDSGDEVGVCMP